MRNLVICWGVPQIGIIDYDCPFTLHSISIPVCSIGRGISTQPTEHRRDPWVRPSISSGISTLLGPRDQVSVGDKWEIVRVWAVSILFQQKGGGRFYARVWRVQRGISSALTDVLWGISSVHIAYIVMALACLWCIKVYTISEVKWGISSLLITVHSGVFPPWILLSHTSILMQLRMRQSCHCPYKRAYETPLAPYRLFVIPWWASP